MRRFLIQATAIMATILPLAGADAADFNSTKGIYIDSSKSGVRWDLILVRGSQRQQVTESYPFRTGDRFQMQISVNKPGYVYILNRTLNGNPNELKTKGIDIVAEEDRKREPAPGETYHLIYPARLTSTPSQLAAGRSYAIPAEGAFMRMDQTPGVEKVFVIYSPMPLDITKYFADNGEKVKITGAPVVKTNSPKKPSPTPPSSPQLPLAGHTVDSDEDIVARLDDDLKAYGENTQIARNASEKGIAIVRADGPAAPSPSGPVTSSYGVVADSSKPASFEITLQHHP